MIFQIKRLSICSLLIMMSLTSIAQSDNKSSEPFLGFTDNRDVYFQLYLGLGYSWYSMKNEEDRVSFLQDQDFDVDDMTGSFSFNGGMATVVKSPRLRILLDYRGDSYSNTSYLPSIFNFGSDDQKGYELSHDIYNLSVGLEKLLFHTEENDSYFGLGASYVFIRDIRSEKLLFKSNGSNRTAKTSADILAKAIQLHVSIGGIKKGHVFGEARFGYQFQQSFSIQSNKTKPGQSTSGYVPDFNSFTFKLVVGILL